MGDLSEHFNSWEFACHCGCGESDVSQKLIDSLEELRLKAGQPIMILSGRRCKRHNEAVGGAENSQHKLGKAADIRIRTMTPKETMDLAKMVDSFRRGGIGFYPKNGFVHVDVRGFPARWGGA